MAHHYALLSPHTRSPQRAPVSKSRRRGKKGKGTDSDNEAPKPSANDAVNAGITVQAVSYAMYYNNVLFLVRALPTRPHTQHMPVPRRRPRFVCRDAPVAPPWPFADPHARRRWCPQVLFLVLAFNVVPSGVPSFINYIVSVVGPSVVAFMLS